MVVSEQLDFANITYNITGDNGIAVSQVSMDGTRKFSSDVNLAAYCYIMPTVAVVGLLGNVANLITLANPRLKAVSYMYLRALGIADLLCMCFVLVFVFFEILKHHHYDSIVGDYGATWYRAHLLLPLINASISAGVLTVVALTVERYISICWPLLFRDWNTPRRAGTLILLAYVISFLLYIPQSWEMQVVPKNGSVFTHSENSTNGTSFLYGTILWTDRYDDVVKQKSGHIAYKWTRETLLKFIPIVSLAVLNLHIIFAFRKIRKRRQRLTSSANQNVREQRSLLILLAGIAILFFVCNTPAAINLVFISEEAKKLYGFVIFRAVSNLLEITNHALNFYVFCLCSTDYRQTFLQTFPMVKNLSQRTTHFRRRMSERKFLKSKSISDNSSTSTILTSSNKKLINGDKKKRQKKSNGIRPTSDSTDKKRRRTSKNLNEKFIHAMANDEERQPMTADHYSDGTTEVSYDKYGLDNNVIVCSDNSAATDNSVTRCNFATVLTNGDSVRINKINSASFNDDFIDDIDKQSVDDYNRRKSDALSSDKNGTRKQFTTIIINEYCLCDDEGADDVSL